ncbi:helix-turn-helix transcriptional regulator [Bacillus carboniphilus]|uniref:Helix-turn-helix transcriptional regulator n=1 Tax=Bacillus carboniphilus TaxID=86663 RepID=A0ABY9JTA6_9BACI|nr:helix-turn-helix transcriptional regulator [Bacillus carboniphilus]WLR42059.1 helix-turn-helix transcriptional regulator [Bacillus carboniphilus]
MITKMKEMRARHSLTQAELAKQAGVRRETIVFLEKGEYNPSLKLAVKISRILDTPVEELFLFEEEELK